MYSVPHHTTLLPLSTESFGICAREGCDLPALAVCGLTLPSLLGPLRAFFCFPDYLSAVKTLLTIDYQGTDSRETADAMRSLRERVVPLAPRLLGGTWPSREELMAQWNAAKQMYEQCRQTYQQAEEDQTRVMVIHRAALFLFAAFCLEDRPGQEPDHLYNLVVDATWSQIVAPFLTEERMILFEKEITPNQVLLALVAVIFSRLAGAINEELERTTIAQALTATAQERTSFPDNGQPELLRALTLLEGYRTAQQQPKQGYWGPLSVQARNENKKRARTNTLLSEGLRRLREKKPPTTTQAPFVAEYVQTFLSQIALLKQQREGATHEADRWRHDYFRLAKAWNALLEKSRTESS